MNIPAVLQIGDTWGWSASFPGYPASKWTLKYAIQCVGRPIKITAGSSGAEHIVSVPALATEGFPPGRYRWSAYAEKESEGLLDRRTIATGFVTLRPALYAADASTDNRSTAAVMLANIEEAIKVLSSKTADSVTVNGRTVTYRDLGKLLQDRSRLRAEVAREEAAAPMSQGIGRQVRVRF